MRDPFARRIAMLAGVLVLSPAMLAREREETKTKVGYLYLAK